ncbi:MAG TPA: hypothetical protein VKU02_01900 [Gemmataceae bacterium]|nr:hypothetical protein [Gemmataceae bacterium]
MNNPSNRSRFFGFPVSWRGWSGMGQRFWAGVLMGIGLGLLLGAALLEQNLMAVDRKAWVSVTGIVLAFLGLTIARRAVKRDQVDA